MADLFDTAQAKRLYGFIAAGGTVGALAGPALTAGFVTLVGVRSMLLVSAGFLAVAIVAILDLRRVGGARGRRAARRPGRGRRPRGGAADRRQHLGRHHRHRPLAVPAGDLLLPLRLLAAVDAALLPADRAGAGGDFRQRRAHAAAGAGRHGGQPADAPRPCN